ncbi:MAG: hypothetical protein HQ546_09555 [Planctomycetes bacterium]|nr:hypothetical protein [Planctomycetota bacterium]
MAKEYNISHTSGLCVNCRKHLQENDQFMAVLVEDGQDFQRQDWCLPCWQSADIGGIANVFGHWQTRVPRRQAEKKTFIDDEMLINFFQRLQGSTAPARVNLRFVLTLVLMRKKLLVYERAVKDAEGNETWTMRLKSDGELHEVIDPRLDEEKIAELSGQLSEILQGHL